MAGDAFEPRVTVAAVVERDGRFLMIEETVRDRLCLNQPAGHWDAGETLTEAAARETLEESGYPFTPEGLVGVYTWDTPDGERTFVRFCFHGTVPDTPAHEDLDDGIVRALWLTRDEIAEQAALPGRVRSPMVLAAVDAWLAGVRLPLAAVQHIA